MWIVLAALSAITSGVAVIFQKKGTSGNNIIQICAVHLLAIFVTVFCVTLLKGGWGQFASVTCRSWWLAVSSGLVQAASWIAYFLAMKKANVSFLMVLDKTGVVVTVLLAAVFLDEQITPAIVLGSVLILTGTALMYALHGGVSLLMNSENHWVIWGTVSPALQAISNMLAALDKTPVDTSVTTTIRMLTVVVCICTLARIKEGPFGRLVTLGVKKLSSLIIGGVILGVSYLLMYEAFSLGKVSAVTAIVRANFLITTMLAQMIFKEKLSKKGMSGFILVLFGVALFVL